MLEFIQLLVVAIILGGMVAFQVLFAPLIFIKLPNDVARPFIRKFFPFYYLYFGILSTALAGIAYLLLSQNFGAWLLVVTTASALGFFVSRQVFMPLANKATDEGRQADFNRYHRITVLINTVQLIAMVIVLWLIT
ncbi:DUF4149 domain-containing protein [Brumicola nitratireducens]|uniref:TMEM205-like domain-containing protein n=1 Tax=Glaciecola nitratireducens (strain JCM 12485 / KCTC 12276 / FR1064) TaxID=1085623 RepID=G4QM84_GLANF|nr:DUF4149 domain-containing protein [Glaciecola nitratireducens]AEP30736.1 hypothetical protein GNIT_2639 [Glaciecola nitratireducens FR1064]